MQKQSNVTTFAGVAPGTKEGDIDSLLVQTCIDFVKGGPHGDRIGQINYVSNAAPLKTFAGTLVAAPQVNFKFANGEGRGLIKLQAEKNDEQWLVRELQKD
ncbi:hypothetical protein [Aliagarivorans taiwanensis]|uniref:hypothetical protein n=1 Tax=Aliagarivorans taiwanensis TaxID=561966 RepID=UPI00041248E1|nr:hypothetical protein [Aliagarivorans taiwanensis]